MPKSVLTRRRSFVARITALAMVASLMAFGAMPASAAVETDDACPATIPSAGFTDIGGLDATTQQAINCLADYGISQGTSATTFSPNGEVTRWQMALFLIRQASEHGVALPTGAPQGFGDIATLPAATQTAINQLAQLGITTGTSSTTFSPNDAVTRWQMALFLTRLVDAAPGVALPPGQPQGFTDLGGLSNAAQTAINQLKQLGIADGTSATTYNPMAAVLRWQMALFLTRTLQVGGVTPTNNLVTVAPGDAVTLNVGQARTFTATFNNPDGTPYVNPVGITVRKATAAQPVATDTRITAATDGLAGLNTHTLTGFPGADGAVTFTITNTVNAENVVVIAWQDNVAPIGNGTLDAGEPTDTTGTITFQALPPGAALTNANYAGYTVNSTVKANNTLVATPGAPDCGTGAGTPCTFTYDANDIFAIGAAAATLDQFEAALSAGDTIAVNYQATEAGQSNWVLTNVVSVLDVTSPAAPVEVDANSYTIAGVSNPGATIRIYNDANNNGAIDAPDDGVVATTTASVDGAWSVVVPLVQNAANNFVATQVNGITESAPEDVPTITEGANVAASINSTVYADNGAAGPVNLTDTIAITFSEAIASVSDGDSVTFVDDNGTTAQLVLGSNVSWALGGGNTVLTLTVTAAIPGTGNTNGLQGTVTLTAINGFQGADGLAINVAGSPANQRSFQN